MKLIYLLSDVPQYGITRLDRGLSVLAVQPVVIFGCGGIDFEITEQRALLPFCSFFVVFYKKKRYQTFMGFFSGKVTHIEEFHRV